MDERRIVGFDATAERVVHASARRAGSYGHGCGIDIDEAAIGVANENAHLICVGSGTKSGAATHGERVPDIPLDLDTERRLDRPRALRRR